MKRQMMTILGGTLALFLLFTGKSMAQEESANREEGQVSLSSTIVGNQEQPKVLYIVPWKAVSASEVENQTIQSQLDVVFGHVEPIELRRELIYLKELADSAQDDGN